MKASTFVRWQTDHWDLESLTCENKFTEITTNKMLYVFNNPEN